MNETIFVFWLIQNKFKLMNQNLASFYSEPPKTIDIQRQFTPITFEWEKLQHANGGISPAL